MKSFPVEPPSPTALSLESFSVADVMRAVKKIQIEISMLRGLLSDAAQKKYRAGGGVEGLSTRGAEFPGPVRYPPTPPVVSESCPIRRDGPLMSNG
jgi:hypothetical protein